MKAKLPPDTTVVLIGQTPWIHFYPIKMLCFKNRVPVVVDCWEIWGDYWIDYYGALYGRIGRYIEKNVVRCADHIMAISHMTFDMVKNVGVSVERITLAPNGVEINVVKSIKTSLELSDVVYFGRLVAHKNVDVLIKAVEIVRPLYPEIRVLILGGGPEQVRLEKLASDLGVKNNIKFLGLMESHSEAMSILKASKVFVQPSTSEGGGSIAVIEAFACGLPVIAVRHPQGIDPRLIDDNISGMWINKLSEKLLAEALIKILFCSNLLTMKRHVENVAEKFDWGLIALNYDKLFESLASRKC